MGDLAKHQNPKLIASPKNHAKTLIMDDTLIAEGSFNWLCAARDEVYRSHKHEGTFICEGPKAKGFIEKFYESDPGKLVARALQENPPQENKKKRKRQRDHPSGKKSKLPPSEDNSDMFFSERREELERDIWSHHPFWIQYNDGYISLVYERYFEVMSGEPFGREGFCVRVNKKFYLGGESGIKYFDNLQDAKKATFDFRKDRYTFEW